MMKFPIHFLLLLLIFGCSGKPYVVEYSKDQESNRKHRVYVANHGWHTGLILPAKGINPRLPFLFERFGGVTYYEFGWGDQDFYQAKAVSFALTVKAVLWPTDSVVHVVAINDSPPDYFKGSEVIELSLLDFQFESLTQFILNSFSRTEEKRVIALKEGLYGNSHFYRGEGDYYLFNTCNKWTAKGLQSAGMNITPTFTLFADSVTDYLKENCDPLTFECNGQE